MHLSNSVYDRCTLKSKIWKNTYELWALNQIKYCILPEDVSDKTFLSVSLAFLYPTGTGKDTDTYWPGCMSIHIGIVYPSFASGFSDYLCLNSKNIQVSYGDNKMLMHRESSEALSKKN